MLRPLPFLCLLALLLRCAAGADEARLACVADTNLSSYPTERELNYGRSPRIRLKGIEMLGLFDFDLSRVAGWRIETATLFLRYAGDERALRTVGVSTVATPWEEGTGAGERRPGECCFAARALGKLAWAGPTTDFTDVSYTAAGTTACYADVRDAGDGWVGVPVDPRLVQAMLAGRTHGLAVSDEKGQTRANNDVFAREQSGSEPYLVVTGRPGGGQSAPSVAPPVVRQPARRRSPALLRPPAGGCAGATGVWASRGLRVWACADTEKVHPVTGRLLEADAAAYGTAPQGGVSTSTVARGGAVRLHGARGESVAFQVMVGADRPTAGLRIRAPRAWRSPDGRISVQPQTALYRVWYVKDGEWYPEACIPLGGPFDIPAADNAVAGQRIQAIFVDLLVPKSASPGAYRGAFVVEGAGARVTVPAVLEVNRLAMPDTLTFDVSLNTYGTMGHLFGLDDRTPEYCALERAYHRMAHAHRATLAVLGYSHGGTYSSNYAPPLEGEGAGRRVADWRAWDAQFGPYLDGSAFADMPRAGVPVAHFYLPFNEAWPADIRQHYAWKPTTAEYPAIIVEHALNAPPIEQALDRPYADAMVAVVRQFAEHFRQKRWNRTGFQFYLNNKYYYRDPKLGGRGTSWWLLDEPNDRDDWLALAYFGRLMRRALAGAPGSGIVFREDVSRPQWQRGYLDGLVDLMVVGAALYEKGPMLAEMRQRLGVRYWNYAAANPVRNSNLEAEAWSVRAWLAGADAVVPWQSVGSDENYTRPDETALLLPGRRFGIEGPVASLRLKALRRSQQDCEYLNILARAKGWDRDQTAAALSGILRLGLAFEQRGPEDAGLYRFGTLRTGDFDALRRAIAASVGAVGRPAGARTAGGRPRSF